MMKPTDWVAFTLRSLRAMVLTLAPAASCLHAQDFGGAGLNRKVTYENTDKDGRPYDKHDLSGLWSRNPSQYGLTACPECREQGPVPGYGYRGTPPARTPEGEKRLNAIKPSRGIEKDTAYAKAHPEVDIGFKRAIPPALSNDPLQTCTPLGLPRLITYSGGGAAMEIVQTKDRIIQNFEWNWDHRDIWMDGRKLPKVDDYIPRYNGFSVAKWEGDTLVVTSNGFDGRAWLDHFGFPYSDEMILEERYQRVSPNRLRLEMTLTDPLVYTAPWHSDSKFWALIPKEKMSVDGWSGLLEDRCVPADEGAFKKVSDAAGGKK